jgi:hypothetical protein
MLEYSATITCDECGDSREYYLPGINTVKTELIAKAERSGWEFRSGEDLCPKCVYGRDREE